MAAEGLVGVVVNGLTPMVGLSSSNALVVVGVRLRLRTVLEFVGYNSTTQATIRRAIAKAAKSARPAEVED